ncbi:MAG: hypothetical protein HOE90_03670 [Bacteriovoracaceae bacterium]|nr:hypothetical protein [Bacteriovoracaceae bacterium]
MYKLFKITVVFLSLISWGITYASVSSICENMKNGTYQDSEKRYTLELNQSNLWDFASENDDEQWAKFVTVKCDDSEVFVFQNSAKFPTHYDFLNKVIYSDTLSKEQFKAMTLGRKGRVHLLGVLNYKRNFEGYEPGTHYQFISSDNFSASEIYQLKVNLLSRVKLTLLHIYYFPSPLIRQAVKDDRDAYNTLGIDVEFPGQPREYISYSAGWSAGKVVRILSSEIETKWISGEITAKDILVVDKVPRDIPPVAGIITSETSSSFSHVALLSKMMGTVFLYEKDAYFLDKWKQRENTLVFIETKEKEDHFYSDVRSIVEIRDNLTEKDIEKVLRVRTIPARKIPEFNHQYAKLKSIDSYIFSDKNKIGAKAANLGFICQALEECPIGFALPFSYYENHLDTSLASGFTIRETIKALLEGNDLSAVELSKTLQQIRDLIKTTAVNRGDFKKIYGEIQRVFGKDEVRIKLRSSSNVEDLKNFNGAGLYSSKAASSISKEEIEKDLKKVWASLYSERAYIARNLAGLKGLGTSMAVVVQASYIGELARGVLFIDKSGYGKKPKVIVSGFPGDQLKVVDAPAGKVPEIVELSSYGRTKLVRKTTELPDGQRVLTEAQYQELQSKSSKLFGRWITSRSLDEKKVVLDMEWKLLASGEIIIKQLRPVPEKSGSQNDQLVTTVVGNKGAILRIKLRESSNGLIALALNMDLELDSMAFIFDESLSTVGPITKVSGKNRGGIPFEVNANMMKGNFSKTAWGEKYSGYEYEVREVSFVLEVPLPDVPSFKILMKREERRLPGTSRVTNPIVSIEELDFEVLALKSDLPGYNPEYKNREISVEAEIVPVPMVDKVIEELTETYQSTSGYSIELKMELLLSEGYDARGLDYYNVTSGKITGLIEKDIEFNSPLAVEYSAIDHNSEFGIAFDFLFADNLTEAEKVDLIKIHGRYLHFEPAWEDY